MEFLVKRDDLLKALQVVLGAVEKRQTMPILANVLLVTKENTIRITATDLEIELTTEIPIELVQSGKITVNAKKLLDISRTLAAGTSIQCSLQNNRFMLTVQQSQFNVTTLPAENFPNVSNKFKEQFELSIPQNELKKLIDRTYFAMAQEDLRYYLNSILFELNQGVIKFVSTDGHRLAQAFVQTEEASLEKNKLKSLKESFIIPRKCIMELRRLLGGDDHNLSVKISFGAGHFRMITPSFLLISKLFEGKFPDYHKVIPKLGDKVAIVNREALHRSLARVFILSNESHRGVRLLFDSLLSISANNPEQEEAKEEMPIHYEGERIEMGCNVNYLIDVCEGFSTVENLKITLSDVNKGILIESDEDPTVLYVVMPMRL